MVSGHTGEPQYVLRGRLLPQPLTLPLSLPLPTGGEHKDSEQRPARPESLSEAVPQILLLLRLLLARWQH